MKMAPIQSLSQLKCKARKDETYSQLAIIAAKNLGGDPKTLDEALRWLDISASEGGDEEGVVEEINFCIPLVGK
jgi:hypothetical protein